MIEEQKLNAGALGTVPSIRGNKLESAVSSVREQIPLDDQG